MLDDTTFDEDMENSDEDSEEDEGSEYVPSETTSESDTGADGTLENLVGEPPQEPCKFLLLLPRELRDKVRGFSANVLDCVPCSDCKLTYLDLQIRPKTGHSHFRPHNQVQVLVLSQANDDSEQTYLAFANL